MRPRVRATGETKMDVTNFQSFAVEFAKLVQIMEQVRIDKDVNVDVFVKGTLAMANTKAIADAEALGTDTVTQTLAVTTTDTTVVQGVGSMSHADAISQSLSAASPVRDWHITM
jgi:hypothetical protein